MNACQVCQNRCNNAGRVPASLACRSYTSSRPRSIPSFGCWVAAGGRWRTVPLFRDPDGRRQSTRYACLDPVVRGGRGSQQPARAEERAGRVQPRAPHRQPCGGRDRGRARAQRRWTAHAWRDARPPGFDPWARCCGWTVRGCRASRGPRWCATSASARASCCTSTPGSWGASGTSASASSATGARAAPAPAGSTCTSPSTTTRGWPTPRCSPATAATMPSRSSSGRCAGSANRASRSKQS